ncbi:hypothetical protein LQ948_05220 [Jiella sp. MQZ9-1]|uniref:Uncharacterized protein n=1 Tax=Jiella flava TaxID=2816857 RepID=A0A939FXK8_9HYPH|nr:hypothetical protein [Jiella flava]MBO0662066.1 hypothetical protein [Jiella flava]MCD2470606.1 hypothetical protein [Jiella flava]
MKLMKAVICEGFGPIENSLLGKVPAPEPTARRVTIAMDAIKRELSERASAPGA